MADLFKKYESTTPGRDLFAKPAGPEMDVEAKEYLLPLRSQYNIGDAVPAANVVDEAVKRSGLPRAEFMVRHGLVQRPPEDRPGYAAGLAEQGAQGALSGLADEIKGHGAAARAALSGADPAEAYGMSTATDRYEQEQFQRKNPIASTAARLVGGAPLAVATGAASLPATGAKGVLTAAGTGAGLGAASGAGEAEGGIGERAAGAGKGAALGATLGVGLHGIGRTAINSLNAAFPGQAPDVSLDLLIRAFRRDGMTLQQAERQVADWATAGGKPEMLFDLGGENVKGLARSVAQRPGAGKNIAVDALENRQEGQFDRIADSVAKGVNNKDFYSTFEALNQQRRADASPLYEAAYAKGPVTSDRINQFLQEPDIKSGIRKGLEIERREALAEGRDFNPLDYATAIDPDGNVRVIATPNLRLLDAAKKGLDNQLEQYRDTTTGRLVLDPEGRSIEKLRKSFVSAIDEAAENGGVPEYKAARAAWAGPSENMDAMRMGRNIFKGDAEVTAKTIRGMSDTEKDFFRTGVAREIIDRMKGGTITADGIKKFFKTRTQQERLRNAFPDQESYDRFAGSLEREAEMYKNAQIVSPRSGSQTAQRSLEAFEDTEPTAVMDTLRRIGQGQSTKGAVLRTALDRGRGLVQRGGVGMTEERAAALAPRLFDPTYSGMLDTLRDMGKRTRVLDQQAIDTAGRLRAVTSAPGVAAGELTGPRPRGLSAPIGARP